MSIASDAMLHRPCPKCGVLNSPPFSTSEIIVHELKSPLTAIWGYAETLRAQWDRLSEDEKLHKVDKVLDNLIEAVRLMNVSFNQPLTHEMDWHVECTEIPVMALLRNTVDNLTCYYDKLAIKILPMDTQVWVDPNAFAIILQHLIDNAYQYGKVNNVIYLESIDSPVHVGVSVRNMTNGSRVVLTETIFQPNPVKASTGLGLHIVKKYVEMMDGAINFAQDEENTTFTLWIKKT